MSKEKQNSILEDFSKALNETQPNELRNLSLNELEDRRIKLKRKMKTLTLCSNLSLNQPSDAIWDGLIENVLVFSSLLKPSSPWAITLFNYDDFQLIKKKHKIQEVHVFYLRDFDIVVVCSDSVERYKTENEFLLALQKCYNTYLIHQIKDIALEISQIDLLTTKAA